jgi:acyl carrier protein
MDTDKFVKDILQHALHLGEEVASFSNSTSLLGSLPELDSIGVVNIITMIEDQLGCSIEDDEINAEVFETFGSLVSFIENKL